MGWTSFHWLHKVEQHTLILAGRDDPIVPIINAKLLKWRLPNCRLHSLNCGHLFLLTRPKHSAYIIRKFLNNEGEIGIDIYESGETIEKPQDEKSSLSATA